MRSFQTDLKRALTSWGFWVCAAGIPVACVIAAFGSFLNGARSGAPLDAGFHATALLAALSSDTVFFTVPVLCGIGYASAFVEDVKSGYIKFYQMRIGRLRYVAAKALATALSGGLALLVGILIAYLAFLAFFGPREARVTQAMAGAVPGFQGVLSEAMLFFLVGSFWSLVGQLFACFTMNRYVAYACPFIFYYVLVILSERYWADLYLLNPTHWFSLAEAWEGNLWNAAGFLLGIASAVGVLFGIVASRRLR